MLHTHVHRLDLHSFPTRRSSDLGTANGGAMRASGYSARSMGSCSTATRYVAREALNFVARCCTSSSSNHGHIRSEEHTSELQSLRHLVCRLLLEKQNSNRRDI